MALTHSDPVREEYSRLAGRYDRRWSAYINATVRETLARLECRSGDRLLDVGCGTGALLSALAKSRPDLGLIGIDPSPEMLAVAAERTPRPVGLVQARADALPFPDARFDLAVSTSAFHYFREPRRALLEMRRVLRPGGTLYITDWCHDFLSCQACDLVLRQFNRAHFRTYGAVDCAALLREAGLADVQVDRYKINWLWGLMTARGRR